MKGSQLLRIHRQDMWYRAFRYDPTRIQGQQALKIMALDMFEACGVPKRIHTPIKIPHPSMNVWVIVADHAFVGFKERDVHWIEADDGHVQTDVCLGDAGTEVIWTLSA